MQSSPSRSHILILIALVGLLALCGWVAFMMFKASDEVAMLSRNNPQPVHPTLAASAPFTADSPPTEIDPTEDVAVEDEHLAYVPDELILKVGSKEEVIELLQLALANGGEFVDAVAALKTFRLRFGSEEDAIRFRNQLGDAYQTENNHLVKAPDYPDYPDYETRDESESQSLTGFGTKALDWLGISGDHSEWGAGVLVAILDTGMYAHESFAGMTVSQLDLVGGADAVVTDYDSHGTAVASVSAQVAPASDILSIRVLDAEGLGNSYTVASGIVTAVDSGASVINLSVGGYSDSTVLREAVAYAIDSGVAVVAAAGIDGSNAPSYPAAYEGVVGVSAVDAEGQIAHFSNYGDAVDLAAPGVEIVAAWEDSASVTMSGTSAAAPFVTGAVAALLSTGIAATGAEAVGMLETHAADLGTTGVDADFGYGALQLGELF